MATTAITNRQGDTISAIAYRYYGQSRGKVEQILEANPRLCGQPAVLPAGIKIIMPSAAAASAEFVATVNLWD